MFFTSLHAKGYELEDWTSTFYNLLEELDNMYSEVCSEVDNLSPELVGCVKTSAILKELNTAPNGSGLACETRVLDEL